MFSQSPEVVNLPLWDMFRAIKTLPYFLWHVCGCVSGYAYYVCLESSQETHPLFFLF